MKAVKTIYALFVFACAIPVAVVIQILEVAKWIADEIDKKMV